MSSPSNTALGDLLGVSHATVSRWRSGDRLPELTNMQKIAQTLDWPLTDQVDARDSGKYADEFSKRVGSLELDDSVGAVGKETPQDQ